jgi:hypothetical protein
MKFQLQLILLNLSCTLVLTAPWTAQNNLWNVNGNADGSQPHLYHGRAISNGSKYHPSPKDWRKESIYQLITDRFSDGNPLNNEGDPLFGHLKTTFPFLIYTHIRIPSLFLYL